MVRLTQSCCLQETRIPAATSRIRLLHIYGAGCQHAAEIIEVVSILSRGDIHHRGSPLADKGEPWEIVSRYRLLEPADIRLLREEFGEHQRLLAPVGAVRVDK